MGDRLSIFEEDPTSAAGDEVDVSDFAPVRAHRPDMAATRELAERHGFSDREGGSARQTSAPPAAGPQEQRRYRTGRNKQLSLKVTDEAQQRFYAIVEQQGWVLGDAFARAVEALEDKLKHERLSGG
jgi:hypothetical protein